MKKFLSSIKDKRTIWAALAVLVSIDIVASYTNATMFTVAILLSLIYLVFIVIITLFEVNGKIPENSSSLLSNLTVDFLMKLDMPVTIINEDDMIIWYNKAFGLYDIDKTIQYGKSISLATNNEINFEKITKHKSNDNHLPSNANVFGIPFEIRAYQINSKGKNYYLTIWYDNTKLNESKRIIEETNPLIAYIVVDNLNEIIQNIQEDYRTASANVARSLNEWANSIGAVLKEYERDKFIMIFSQKHLESMINNKFDVLDKIREQSESNMSVPLTITIGISNIIGSFSEKENMSRQALEYGLQRGGDQVVVKSTNDTQIFGGRTRTVQKRTKIRSRIIAHDLVSLIKNSSNVLVMGHKYSDFDSLGAAIGISRLCMYHNKKVNIISNLTDINLNVIQKKLEKVSEYENVFIDKITGQDLINSDTLLIIADVNNKNLFESSEIFENTRKVVVIDHHRKTE